MNAYEIPSLRFSLISGAAVARRRFVKINSSEQAVQAGNGEAAIGVSTVDASAANQVLDIADGIVIVEAGAAVAVGSQVQSDALGKAVVRTTGYIIGTAMTAAAHAGELIAVKTPSVSSSTATSLFAQSLLIEDLGAGVDIADRPVFAVPTGYTFTLISAIIIPHGAAAGVDDDSTCVIAIKEAANTVVSKTYNTAVVVPDAGVSQSLGAITNATALVAGKVLCVNVTNGTDANPPAFTLQLLGVLTAL